jgi:hypothetical protein
MHAESPFAVNGMVAANGVVAAYGPAYVPKDPLMHAESPCDKYGVFFSKTRCGRNAPGECVHTHIEEAQRPLHI